MNSKKLTAEELTEKQEKVKAWLQYIGQNLWGKNERFF